MVGRDTKFIAAVWKSGATTSDTSSEAMSRSRIGFSTAKVTPPWVSTTPFGFPVVPEVYMMKHGSSWPTGMSMRAASASAMSCSYPRASSSGSPSTTTRREVPASCAAADATGPRSAEWMRTVAPESVSAYVTSGAVRRALSGTRMAPSNPAAKSASR